MEHLGLMQTWRVRGNPAFVANGDDDAVDNKEDVGDAEYDVRLNRSVVCP